MKRVSVICAFPAGLNTGMVSVDSAAMQFLGSMLNSADIQTYVLGDPARIKWAKKDLPFEHKPLHQHFDQVRDSDAILYWGDFLHSGGYIHNELAARLVSHGLAGSGTEAVDLAYKYHLLEDQPKEVMRKVILFGGTLITNSRNFAGGERYRKALNSLVSNVCSVYFRDALSAAYAAPFRSNERTLGLDPAFLLGVDGLGTLLAGGDSATETRSGVGVFFGRSPNPLRNYLFARRFATEVNEDLRWLHWFPPNLREYGSIYRFVPNARNFVTKSPEAIFDEIRKLRFVVTDTYHLCVNAWRLGVPAICIGRAACNNDTTILDFKKQVLYSMYGASRLYVFTEDIYWPAGILGVAKRLASAAKDEVLVRDIEQQLARHALSARAELIARLSQLLG